MSTLSTADCTETDTDLIARVRAGDIHAYAELYDRHHAGALAVATTVAGRSRAEDLVAEAFTQILNLLLAGRGPEQVFRSYLFTAIRNTHLSHIRKDRRVILVEDFISIEADHAAPDPWPGLIEDQFVRRALASLPERWQTVIRLATVEERPLEEVAATLEIGLGAAAQLGHRAREALRSLHNVQPRQCVPGPGK